MASDKSPSSAGYWIGAVCIVLAITAGIGGPVFGFAQLFGKLADFDFVQGTEEVQLETGTYWILSDSFAEDVVITNEEGDRIAISNFDPNTEVNYEGYSGSGQFRIDESGTYSVEVGRSELSSRRGTTNSAYIGPALNEEVGIFIGALFGGILGGIVLFFIGVILMIVTGVRRSRARKSQGPPGGFGGPYGGTPGYQPPAPGGYAPPPAPGGYQQPPPAPGGYTPPPAPQQAPPQPPPQGGEPGTF